MNQDNSSFSLFADDDQQALRQDAIDQLHHATAIYTAEPVVDELLGQVKWPNGGARLVDPSCGDGMFLARALTKALNTRAFTDDELPQIIEGWEIHPYACSQARARVEATLISFGRSSVQAAKIAQAIVHNRDFLTQGPLVPTWDVIAGNPPYLRWVNVPELLKQEYAALVPAYANADLLHSFLDRCCQNLRPHGQIALVTSDRWLFNLGASKLRARLGQELNIAYLKRLDVNSAFYRPKQRKAGSPPRIHPVSVILSADGAIPMTADAIYPEVATADYQGYKTLEEIATVKLAPWLGSAGVFVLSAEEAAASGIPSCSLVPAVDTDDIVRSTIGGKVIARVGTPTRYAIRTNPKEMPGTEIMRHLEANMHRMAGRGLKGKFWMPPESFHNRDLTQPCLLVPRIALTPTAVRVPAGILPINHNLSIVTGSAETLDRVERALQSPLAREWVSSHAARLENGYFSLTTKLLRKLPIDE